MTNLAVVPNEVPSCALSKDDIVALRKADDICFYHRKGASYIRAVKRAKTGKAVLFTTRDDAERTVPCQHVSNRYSTDYPEAWNAFAMIHGSQYGQEWQTIVKLLRPNDEIELNWYRDAGTTEALKEHGFHGDHLYLHIIRKGKRELAFLVDASVCHDNTARMIRAGEGY